MKFAICNELFQDRPLPQTLDFIRGLGYSGLEIAPFTLGHSALDVPAATRRETRRQILDAGLETVGLHWLLAKTEGYYLTSPDPEIRRRTGEYFIALTRLCADLGGSIMVLGSPQQRNLLPGVTMEQALDHAAGVIRQAKPTLRDCGVTLALEPLGPAEGDFLNTAQSAIELAQRIDSPQVRLHLDVKAMASESKPIPAIIRDSAEWTTHFHANDPNLLGPGMGDVDFHPVFAALQETGYDGWVSVEVFDDSPGIDQIARESIDYMKTCLGALT